MADQETHISQTQTKLTTLTLPLRPRMGDQATMLSEIRTAIPPGLVSPGISVEFHGDPTAKLAPIYPRSAPPDVQSFPSPMRHHRRTPSAHREIKETLNARSEYTNEDDEGGSNHHINQYVVKDEIGRGSYGAVHIATDQFGNEYAVKAFSKARLRKRAQSAILRHGPRQLGRFPRAEFGAPDAPITSFSVQRAKEAKDALYLIREEVAIMKKLNHPNLVQLMEVLDDPEDDSLYMVMEMCKKGVVMKVGLGEFATPYEEEQCRYWFRDLILGIEYLHSQGVVHRDIKPENLLLTDDDVLKIVDFGVSEMFEKSDDMRTAKSAGSPAFLPPELCVARHGDVSGKAADIWSMGVSLYCLRYGRIPFERDGVLEMYEAIKTDEPKLPSDENPDFVDLMGRLLEKDPEKRINMLELREHPWVTKGGTDPLLSAEENCSDLVDPPNSLELNHAFTRRMSHLICVMKAISKFKSLLTPRPTVLQTGLHHHHPETAPVPPSPAPEEKASAQQITAEFAARVLRERQDFLTSGGKASIDQLLKASSSSSSFSSTNPTTATTTTTTEMSAQAATATGHDHQDQNQQQPILLLGIGTGGFDDFSSPDHAPPADIVSDSPTVVDFNVYDRAFEAEIERIKRSTSRRGGGGPGARGKGAAPGSGPGSGPGPGPGTGQIYQTRLSERSGGVGGGGGDATGGENRKLNHPGGTRFADLVAHAMAREEGASREEGAGEDGESNQGQGQVNS
ncbi:kinase-like domain-containing protein [Chaetomidium leptoderma]|uniref:Kinase-like domain-containing protein n=1 Tax=Chaetomidium leptoderma TaxID=669021 RepID=A0AAN6VRC6_9PEZI|nr:kinase-like domain-containing protein [Chaetomidium leptoderma]